MGQVLRLLSRRLRGRPLFVLVIALPLLVAAGTTQPSGTSTAIWVAESNGALSLDEASGNVNLEIPVTPDARTLAIDGTNKAVWIFSGKDLRSFDYSGNQLTVTTVSAPVGNPALLSVDSQAGRVWLAVQSQLYLFNTAGTLLWQARLPQAVTAITVDRLASRLWVAYKGTLLIYDAQGNQYAQVNTSDLKTVTALDYDFKLNQVWVAADNTVRRYSSSGALAFTQQNALFSSLIFVAADQNGGLYAADSRALMHLDGSGNVGFSVTPYGGSSPDYIVSLIADFVDHTAWIASQRHVTHYGADGTKIADFLPSLPDGKNRLIRELALPALPPPPVLKITVPANNAFLNNNSPTFTLTYTGQFIDLTSIKFAQNGVALPVSCNTQAATATCSLLQSLPDGVYDVSASMANTFGAVSQPATVHLTIDTVPPVIAIASPRNGGLTNNRNQPILGSVSEVATLTINGTAVSVQNLQFSYVPTLTEGSNSFQLVATDLAGNVGSASLSITLDTIPPAAPIAGDIRITVSGGQITVSGSAGSVEGGSLVTIVDPASGTQVTVTANADGSFTVTLAGSNGDTLQIYATDAAGNQGASTPITVTGGNPFSGALKFVATSPVNGTTVGGNLVLISVDLQAPPNTGVSVCGVTAMPVTTPTGLRYYALVTLHDGQNSCSIVAQTQDGRTSTETLSLNGGGTQPYLVLAVPSGGSSPLYTRFKIIDQYGLGIQLIQADFSNTGGVDFSTTNPGATIATTYSGPGLHQARLVVVDGSGTSHTQIVPVVVSDPAAVDRSIQAVWAAMNAALVAGDKATAMSFLTSAAQANYSSVFDALLTQMPQIVPTYSALQQVRINPIFAEYAVNRTINGVNHVFLVDFILNQNGQWQLDSM